MEVEISSVKNGRKVPLGVYGCHNKTVSEDHYYLGKYGVDREGKFILRLVENRMSKKCRYDKRENDIMCKGCLCDWDTDYLKQQGLLYDDTKRGTT